MKVYSFALGIVKNQSEAEEIADHTFFRAYLANEQFSGRSDEFTWLCSIARNLCYDYFRGRKRMAEMPDEDRGSEGIEGNFIQKETSLAIHKVLHELAEPYKEVFELRVFGELTFREIAEIFDRTESWARVTYHRARLKIRERMDSDGE